MRCGSVVPQGIFVTFLGTYRSISDAMGGCTVNISNRNTWHGTAPHRECFSEKRICVDFIGILRYNLLSNCWKLTDTISYAVYGGDRYVCFTGNHKAVGRPKKSL